MRPKFLLTILCMLALVAAACSGSDGDGTAATDAIETSSQNDADGGDTDDNGADDNDADEADNSADDDSAGAETGGDDTNGDTSESSDAMASDSTDAATTTERLDYKSPIGDLLGGGVGNGGFDSDIYAEQERQAEILISTCMAEEGFEYIPVDYSSQYDSFDSDSFDKWNSREYAEEFGYGYSTTFEEDISFFSDEFDEAEAIDDPGFGFVDPNEQIVEAMSDGEQTAYYEALHGVYPEFDEFDPETGNPIDPETGEPVADNFWMTFEPGGCSDAAYEQVTSEQAGLDSSAFYTEFADQLDDLDDAMESDPRISELEQKWSSCMSEKGFLFSSPDDVYDAVEERMSPLEDAIYGGEEEDEFAQFQVDVDDDTLAAMSEDELDELYDDFAPSAPELTSEQLEQLDEIATWERELAVADWDCQQGMAQVAIDIRAEYEQNFIDQNQAAITALLEAETGG